MARKNLLADLVADGLTAVNSPPGVGATPETASPPALGARGVVGAMGRSLERLSAERDMARVLEAKIAAGDSVVDIEVTLIDGSFVSDRLTLQGTEIADLVTQIREQGQQVPVLLRPHPERPGRYQIAYGHRRVRALAEIGRPVRALVRQLTDSELVVAQGQENSARRDLTFIERARFATALEDHGFSRDTVMAALSVDKTELSRLLSVSRAIPAALVELVGAAPKAGRGRWMEVARLLAGCQVDHLVAGLRADSAFSAAGSDQRFALLLASISPKKSRARRPSHWSDPDGRRIARIERGKDRVTLSLDEATAPAFGEFIVERLPELYREFRAEASKDPG